MPKRLFKNIENESRSQKLFYETITILISKPTKDNLKGILILEMQKS